MKKKTLTIVSIVAIIIISLLLLGLTYGYFMTTIDGNKNSKSVEVVTGDSKVLYTDLSQDNISEIIKPGFKTVKSFTVQNIGNVSATYSVYLVDVINSFSRTQDITYNLYKKVGTITDVTIATDLSETNGWSRVNTTENVTFPTAMSVIAPNEVIETSNQIYTYVLKVEYYNHPTENQNEDQGKTFGFKVNLRAQDSETNPFSEGTLAYNILNNSMLNKNGTEFSYEPKSQVAENLSLVINSAETENIPATEEDGFWGWDYVGYGSTPEEASTFLNVATGNTDIEKCNSVIGQYIYDLEVIGKVEGCSNTGLPLLSKPKKDYEKVLSTSNDNDGISYYFRGNVEDNYVDFADMCWRIVRIQGDGSIKLVLEDKDEYCKLSNGNWDIGSGHFGFKYYEAGELISLNGTTNSSEIQKLNYLDGGSSSMAEVFKTFQETFTQDELINLKSGNWCLGDKAYTSGTSNTNPLTEDQKLLKIINKETLYYDSYVRLYGKNPKEPTLKCNGTNMDYFADGTDMYVGALTLDEIVYAGAKANYTAKNSDHAYYITNEFSKENSLRFWTLSPSSIQTYSPKIDKVYVVEKNVISGSVTDVEVWGHIDLNTIISFRPAITLREGVMIKVGDGTQNNPYVIE